MKDFDWRLRPLEPFMLKQHTDGGKATATAAATHTHRMDYFFEKTWCRGTQDAKHYLKLKFRGSLQFSFGNWLELFRVSLLIVGQHLSDII